MGDNKVINPKLKIILFIGSFLLVVIVISIFYFIKTNNSSDPSNISIYNDPYSNETIIETPNQTPENYNSDNNIIFLGFSKLLDYGLTSNQLNKLKGYFTDFSLTYKEIITEISLDISSINQSKNESNGEMIINLNVVINRIDQYKTTIEYPDFDDVILNIFNKEDSSIIYSSSTR